MMHTLYHDAFPDSSPSSAGSGGESPPRPEAPGAARCTLAPREGRAMLDPTIDLNFVDLAVVIEKDRAEDWFWAYNRLALDRDPEMFQLILNAPSSEVPAGLVVMWYCNDRPNRVTTHTYGGPLRLILAGDLAAAM